MARTTAYLGTYFSADSHGIYRFFIEDDTGAMTEPELVFEGKNCKYLDLREDVLATALQVENRAGTALLKVTPDKAVLLDKVLEETTAPCYVVQQAGHVYTANYSEGCVMIYRFDIQRLTLEKRIDIGAGAGCHQVLLHEHFLLVPCLLLDCVKLFDVRNDYAPAGELTFPKGTGPRHGVFDKAHRRLFLVSELSNQVFVYQVEDESSFTLKNVYDVSEKQQSPEGKAPACAAIRLSDDEKFLYISVRFTEQTAVFAVEGMCLTKVQETSCGGIHPRDLVLTPKGNHVLTVNRHGGGVVCFSRDNATGKLLKECSRVSAPEGVSIVFHNS